MWGQLLALLYRNARDAVINCIFVTLDPEHHPG
jgi:hypothetical protein